jgi:hypothetical protein
MIISIHRPQRICRDWAAYTADEAGWFEFTNLDPSVTYTVTVEVKGFTAWTSAPVALQPGQSLMLGDIKLGCNRYAQRFGAAYAGSFSNIMIGGAVLPSLDPKANSYLDDLGQNNPTICSAGIAGSWLRANERSVSLIENVADNSSQILAIRSQLGVQSSLVFYDPRSTAHAVSTGAAGGLAERELPATMKNERTGGRI